LSLFDGIVYVKFGGSFLTYKDRPFSVNYDALDKAVQILYRVIDKVKLIIGHGGGSFAHNVVKWYRDSSPEALLTACQEATRRLNTIFVNSLIEHGLKVTGIQTSAIIVEGEKGIEVYTKSIEMALRSSITPILHGECIFSEKTSYRIMSTEEVFETLSRYFKPKAIVLLTDVPGIYTCDPKTCPNPKLIAHIDSRNIDEVLGILKTSSGCDATGSVYGKVALMARLSRELKVRVAIVSGFDVASAVNAILSCGDFRGTIIDMTR